VILGTWKSSTVERVAKISPSFFLRATSGCGRYLL
jgi:hypothetical protein